MNRREFLQVALGGIGFAAARRSLCAGTPAYQRPNTVLCMADELHAWQRSVERSLSGADYP